MCAAHLSRIRMGIFNYPSIKRWIEQEGKITQNAFSSLNSPTISSIHLSSNYTGPPCENVDMQIA